jgi:L-2-hydroxyglutarate oxidase LhgO
MTSLSDSSKNDFLIIGAGIVGLTVAREICIRRLGRVTILEKEASLGAHSSGRNSGVLHAGIYYPPGTLKAELCVKGAKLLREYIAANKLRYLACGKVIVATSTAAVPQIELLLDRAEKNGVRVRKIDPAELKEIEPEAQTCESAIYSPDTGVFDPKEVLTSMKKDLIDLGVRILHEQCVHSIDAKLKEVKTQDATYSYGFLINAGGLHADQIAKKMGHGLNYRIIPFRGTYKKLPKDAAAKIKGLIYPLPDLNMPFLGVHVTRTIGDDVTVGPTAMPALGRENYDGIKGVEPLELPVITWDLLSMAVTNHDNIRNHIRQELLRTFSTSFLQQLQKLAPFTAQTALLPCAKVGIRAQLMDIEKRRLVMDFVTEKGDNSFHILNAVSPAFTSSLAFAQWVCDQI